MPDGKRLADRVATRRGPLPLAAGAVLRHRPCRRRFAPRSGASRCPASPASPIATLADARGDRAERRQRKRWCGSWTRLGRRADARPRPFRPDTVPRQRPHRWRSRTCRARPRRSHRPPCSLTLAATVKKVDNGSDGAAITDSPRTSRLRASALGIDGRQGRAPLEQLAGSRGACLRVGSIIGDNARSHVSFPGSMPSAPGPSWVTSMRPRSRRADAHPLPRAERGVGATSGSPTLRAVLRSLAMLGLSGFAGRHAR